MALPASTKNFTGAGQVGNWADPMNWAGDVAAKSTSVALIPTNAVLNGSFSVRQLMMLGQEAVTINGALTTLGIGLCNSFMVCANAVVTFKATSSLDDHGGLVVGNISTGTVIAQGTALARANIATVSLKLGKAADGVGIVTIDGANWQDSQNAQIGVLGTGTLSVVDGGHLSIGTDLVAGALAGSTGDIVLSNGGTIAVTGHVKIGNSTTAGLAGIGSLSVGAGSLFSAAGGLKITTTGSVILSGGTLSSTVPYASTEVWAKATVTGQGTFSSPAGIADNGTITASGGTLTVDGAITGKGKLDIAAGSTAVLNATTIGNVAIAFTGSNGTLALSHGVASMARISGFDATDKITMSGVNELDWNGKTDTLTLSENNTVVDRLRFIGAFAADPFILSQPPLGGLATISLHQS